LNAFGAQLSFAPAEGVSAYWILWMVQ
jgi:hypothetical protein